MKNNFYYTAYGLVIKSDIKINEFITIDETENIDIEVTLTTVPKYIKDEIELGKLGDGNKDEIWFYAKTAAIYQICSGNTINIELVENSNPYDTNIYLTCSSMGFIMYQRDKIAIHGGTIVMDDKAIILTGDKGTGKSTLTTALRLDGYQFISDDVAAIEIHNVPMINPGFPYQKLCEDAMDAMGYNKEEYFSFMGDTEIKYLVPALNSFINEDVELYAIFELTVGDVNEVKIEEIQGSEKLKKIVRNIYRIEFFRLFGGISSNYMKKCIDIASSIKFYKIIRPKNSFTVEEQIKLIKESVYKNNLLKIN